MNEVCTLPLCHVVDGDAVLNADKRLLRGGDFDRIDGSSAKSADKISIAPLVLDNDRERARERDWQNDMEQQKWIINATWFFYLLAKNLILIL